VFQGLWDDIGSVVGLTPRIMTAVAAAEADPTSANIAEVTAAYAANGQTPPAKLMAHLILQNEKIHPEDTVRGAMLPYLAIGAGLLWLLFRRRRR